MSTFNIESDNFELFFEKQLAAITEIGKAAIPKDLMGIFRHDGTLNYGKIRKLDFQTKLWILWRCLKKRVFIVVESEEAGIELEEFTELRKAIKRRDIGEKKADGLSVQATFITGSRDLCDMFSYLRQLSASPAYNYLNKYKNFKPTKTGQHIKEMNYIARFVRHYESQKKKWNLEKTISMPEWYVLIFLYDKEYALGSEMYHETYKRAYQSSVKKIKMAFRSLQSRGLILKHGLNSGARMQITPMGRELVNSILATYILNC